MHVSQTGQLVWPRLATNELQFHCDCIAHFGTNMSERGNCNVMRAVLCALHDTEAATAMRVGSTAHAHARG